MKTKHGVEWEIFFRVHTNLTGIFGLSKKVDGKIRKNSQLLGFPVIARSEVSILWNI